MNETPTCKLYCIYSDGSEEWVASFLMPEDGERLLAILEERYKSLKWVLR
jgi:hypothetical protein